MLGFSNVVCFTNENPSPMEIITVFFSSNDNSMILRRCLSLSKLRSFAFTVHVIPLKTGIRASDTKRKTDG